MTPLQPPSISARAPSPDDVVGAARALRVLAQGGQLARRHHAEEVERPPRPRVDGGVERELDVSGIAALDEVEGEGEGR